jgi:hypothetical protein
MRGRDEKCIQNFGRKRGGKRPIRKPRHRWEYIGMNLREMECEGVESMHLAQVRD